MDVSTLLSRLSGVRPTGNDRWACRCPSHEDRSPSLTIRVVPDGRILVHCFAGCDTEAVMAAVGLTVSDLFPEPLTRERLPKIHAPFSALDALKALTAESAVVAIAASDIAEGKPMSGVDADRVCVAAGRIATALGAVHG